MFGVNRTSISVVGGQNSRDVSAEKFSKFYVGSARFFYSAGFLSITGDAGSWKSVPVFLKNVLRLRGPLIFLAALLVETLSATVISIGAQINNMRFASYNQRP